MEDSELIALLKARDPTAIQAVQKFYGAYCTAIAEHILGNAADAEECLNDALFKMWNAVWQNPPENLKAYLAKTVRNTAFDRYRSMTAEKRGGGQTQAVLSELEQCLGHTDTPEDAYTAVEMEKLINRFLAGLPDRERQIFMRRYFYAESFSEIARRFRLKEANIRLILSRTRGKLKKYLKTEGYDL